MNLHDRARSIIATNLALQPGETLLVVTDSPTREVGELFYEAACAAEHNALILQMPEGRVAGEEPPAAVAAAMKAADVALCPTAKSITHTNARIAAAAAGTRVVTMPGVTMDMLREGAACADYAQVERLTHKLTERLTRAQTARIEKDGHVLELSLAGRDGVASPGVYREPGASGNFPSGEAYIAPLEDAANGSVVIDGSMVGIGTLASPLVATIEHGRLVRVEGGDENGPYADRLAMLFERPENGTIAELGIGTNEAAKLCGIILEDEKLYGTVHVAFGTNTSFGGTTKAACHLDGIILHPTLYLDNELVIKEGTFV
ncbi:MULTISPECIES: aminopeptidase [Gordonibacter]|uniref:Aminopeptidase n=1 Tax=Gordonibacter faecis TaxID=3047475 RepID=A0ABT7DQ06_9ACTN|nr:MULTISPECIES: aminopeptidase [unclassified Gordonibacter]MDJ1651487.1 aminopeptidase [Gordonibacter sp. KGMB12511]HIW76078.1 aminopeptidase [Candidatus Gordonibacter avicola]